MAFPSRLPLLLIGWASLGMTSAAQPLVTEGRAQAYVLVRPDAGKWEALAAQDLSATVGKMTGVALPVVHQAQKSGIPIVVGELAVEHLHSQLQRVTPPDPILRADAIAIEAGPQGIYLAGSNDDSHYFAAAELMRGWGCRWYMPNAFGECIPRRSSLIQEPIQLAYAPPFEVRSYWISWNGDSTGYAEFAHRNFMNCLRVPAGHAIGAYTKQIATKLGKFEVSSPEAAQAMAELVAEDYGKGKSFSLSMEDGSVSGNQADLDLAGHLRDKYFETQVLSDAYLVFYNRVCQALRQRFPASQAKIGFLAYVNLTLPPQRKIQAEQPLIAYLAPIDVDPNHPFTDPVWSQRRDYLGALKGWVKAMQGRVIVYDYDQSMLLWRDLPNPSHQVLQKEIKEYARLGILGLDTESRNALATTFLNLYFRGQLYWNPELDVQAELKQFYPNFFGPAAASMQAYWTALYEAWEQTRVTEHEHFVIPALYPRPLVEKLGALLTQTRSVQEQPYRERLDFMEHSWSLMNHYTLMLSHESLGNFAEAAKEGDAALAAREQLTAMSETFTTYKRMPESGPAFLPGEVSQMRELERLAQKRVVQSPVFWDYRPDPDDHGIWQNWAEQTTGWQPLRSDLYLQAQLPETRPGFGWYRWQVQLSQRQLEQAHLCCPGLFNESWLYVNGSLVAHRPQKELWWLNDYAFSWDVPLTQLKPGSNWLVLRTKVPLHFAGLFRPPFIYRP